MLFHKDFFRTAVKNIYNVIKLWRMRHFSLAIFKIVRFALLTIVSKNIIEELNEIQKKFLWSNKKCKIKHSTLCNDYKSRGFKM